MNVVIWCVLAAILAALVNAAIIIGALAWYTAHGGWVVDLWSPYFLFPLMSLLVVIQSATTALARFVSDKTGASRIVTGMSFGGVLTFIYLSWVIASSRSSTDYFQSLSYASADIGVLVLAGASGGAAAGALLLLNRNRRIT